MGKGGTKFVGEAVAHRAGRKKSSYTSKELKKNMDTYLETGRHPDLEKAAAQPSGILYPLPDQDPQRPYVFLDITVNNKPAGRLVIELFEDIVPAAARHLLNRCTKGSSASLQGTTVHKLLSGYGLFAGKSTLALFPNSHVPVHHKLQHNVAGAVSVSRDGSEFAISLAKAMKMDDTHQVVGRVHMGSDVLELLADIPVAADDAPLMRIRIAKCGETNARGNHEPLDEAAAKETKEQAAARLKQESADTRSAVMEALQEGMGHKRTADAAGLGPGSSSAAAAAGGCGGGEAAGSSKAAAAAGGGAGGSKAAAAAGGPSAKRSKVLDALLGDDDEDSSSSGGSGSDGD